MGRAVASRRLLSKAPTNMGAIGGAGYGGAMKYSELQFGSVRVEGFFGLGGV